MTIEKEQSILFELFECWCTFNWCLVAIVVFAVAMLGVSRGSYSPRLMHWRQLQTEHSDCVYINDIY